MSSNTNSNGDANPIATIANTLNFDVDIYDVYKPSDGPKGLLKYTHLATVPSGATGQQVQTIRFASQLQAMRTGQIEALNKNYYVQFPVAVLPVSPFSDSNTFSITKAMQEAMESSFKFIKYIQANPGSQVAQGFLTALSATTTTTTKQEDTVNKFFQGTASFKSCTLVTWTAVYSWQTHFTSAWQGVYYLYSLGNPNVGSTTGSGLTLEATLIITSNVLLDSAVLIMARTDNESTIIVMTGDGTMQEQNVGSGNLSVLLNPSWLNVIQTKEKDGNPVVNYVIGAAFSGTINQVQVAGNLNKLTIPDPAKNTKNATETRQSVSFWVSTVTSILGILTGVGMLYIMVVGHKLAKTQKENDAEKGAKDKSDAKNRRDSAGNSTEMNDLAQERQEVQRVNTDLVPRVPETNRQLSLSETILDRVQVVHEQVENLKDVLSEGAPDQSVEDVARDISRARTELQTAMNPATSKGARDVAVGKATVQLKSAHQKLAKVLATNANTFSDAQGKLLDRAESALKAEAAKNEAVERAEVQQKQENMDKVEKPVNEEQFEDPVPDVRDFQAPKFGRIRV